MKKMVCIFLVVTMLFSLSCAAMAASFSTGSLNQGVGANAGSATKTTGTGSAASGSATYASSSRAIFQATVRKPDGANASDTRQFTGAGSFTLPTRMDGYMETRCFATGMIMCSALLIARTLPSPLPL